jgi:DNA replication protein DnaC
MASDLNPAGALIARFLEGRRALTARRDSLAPEIQRAEADLRARAETKRREDWPKHLRACGVGEREVATLTGDLNRAAPAIHAVANWASTPTATAKPFLVLWGPNGTGKSIAAASALWWAARTVRTTAHAMADGPISFEELEHRWGMFATAADLRHAPQWRWQAEQRGRASLYFDRALTVPWLVFDELGREGADTRGEWKARLSELIGARYSRCLRTVITSNCHPSEPRNGLPALAEWVGEAAADRLSHGAEVFEVGGESLRRRTE